MLGCKEYYQDNTDEIEAAWAVHLSENELGSGPDKIKVTNDMFWEFVENEYQNYIENQNDAAMLHLSEGPTYHEKRIYEAEKDKTLK